MGEPSELARPDHRRGRVIGRGLVRAGALVAAVLVLAWTVARDPVAAIYAREAARLEAATARSPDESPLTLRLLNRASAPEARVLVNGRPLAEFDSGEVHLDVRDGDTVQIDARLVAGAVVVLVDDGGAGGTGTRVLTVVGSLETVPWAGSP